MFNNRIADRIVTTDEWDIREAQLANKFTQYHNNLIHQKKMKSLFAPQDNTQKKVSEPVPNGMHQVVCYSIVDLGTQEVQWEGQTLYKRKVRFTFELPNETRVFNADKGEQPMVISREFTLSMHEKSVLRPFIEGWTGQKMNDVVAHQFDIFSLLGKNGLANIVHAKNGANIYANLQSVAPLMKGMSEVEAKNPIVAFETFGWDWDAFNALPSFLRDKISNTPEYSAAQSRLVEESMKNAEVIGSPAPPVKPKEINTSYESEDLPF